MQSTPEVVPAQRAGTDGAARKRLLPEPDRPRSRTASQVLVGLTFSRASPHPPDPRNPPARERQRGRPKLKKSRQQHQAGRKAQRRRPQSATRRYWLTPTVWTKRCGRCGTESSAVAFRFSDRSYICANCIEQLGIRARASKRWSEGGSRAGAGVTVRYECPICCGPHLRSEYSITKEG
jgi:hypothetical protein